MVFVKVYNNAGYKLFYKMIKKNLRHAKALIMNLFPIGFLFWGFLHWNIPLYGQDGIRPFHIQYDFRNDFYKNAQKPDLKRKKLVTRIALGGYLASGLYLGTAWYAQEDLSHFRFFNDWHEWQQMDKVGHMLGGYHASRWLIDLYKWSGMPKSSSLLVGGLGGFLAMSSIEVLDGFSEKWGASVTDIGANAIGSSLAVLNQGLWNENRIQLKFSYITSEYAGDPEFSDLFGTTYPEYILKDYNGQVIWLSCRVHSFLPEGKFKEKYPKWLNWAVGYGAEGLEGGYGKLDRNFIRQREYRQFYFGPDIDLSNIPVKAGWLHTLFSILSIVKIPTPAIRVDENGFGWNWFR